MLSSRDTYLEVLVILFFILLLFAVALCYLLASRHTEAAGLAASPGSLASISCGLQCDLWTVITGGSSDMRQLRNVQHRVVMCLVEPVHRNTELSGTSRSGLLIIYVSIMFRKDTSPLFLASFYTQRNELFL